MKLKHESTTDTRLCEASNLSQHFCPLSSGKTVLYASKMSHRDDCKFYLCNRHGNPTGQTIDAVCDHEPMWIRFVPVTVNKQEYLCVSCNNWKCENIRLINIGTNEVRMAYMGIDVARMCLGESNTLFTVDVEGNISVFNTSSTNFTLKRIVPKVDISFVSDMCYLKEHDMFVLSSWCDKKLCAVRSSDGKIIWNLSKEQIEGEKLDLGELVYLPQVDLLIVGDQYNKRLIIVSGKSGDVVQTVEMNEVTYIDELHVRGEEIIVTQTVEMKEVTSHMNEVHVRREGSIVTYGEVIPVKLHFYSVSFK